MWLKIVPEGVLLHLQIQPNAPRSQVVGPFNGRLKIRIQAPPVEGKANSVLLGFLAEVLDIPVRHLSLLRGDKAKTKDVLCSGLSVAQIRKRLNVENNE